MSIVLLIPSPVLAGVARGCRMALDRNSDRAPDSRGREELIRTFNYVPRLCTMHIRRGSGQSSRLMRTLTCLRPRICRMIEQVSLNHVQSPQRNI